MFDENTDHTYLILLWKLIEAEMDKIGFASFSEAQFRIFLIE